MSGEPTNTTNESPVQENLDIVKDSDAWLQRFYSECGREVTLAYTTLNQMKNWGMAIVGVFISGVIGFGKTDPSQSGHATNVVIFVGAVIAYVMTLRFFVRAILCYINLIRWNTLQSDIVSYRLLRRQSKHGRADTEEESRKKLIDDINEYYHGWASPIDRKTQLVSNLKLGFALLLALPLLFIVIGITELWSDYFVRGLTVFAIGHTLLEINEFFQSTFFDTPKDREKRKDKEQSSGVFPIPVSRGGYLAYWLFIVAISWVVAIWPQFRSTVCGLLSCGGHSTG